MRRVRNTEGVVGREKEESVTFHSGLGSTSIYVEHKEFAQHT